MNYPAIYVSLLLIANAGAQSTYQDAIGDVAVPGGHFPQLDIESVEVSGSPGASLLTFRVIVNGDPLNPNWGNYLVGLKAGAGGTPTGIGGSARPINFPSGMTHYLATKSTGGEIWTRGAAQWTQTATFSQSRDTLERAVIFAVPYAALGLSNGQTITFDVYTSGNGATDGAVDALSTSGSSITNWSDSFDSLEPLSFTLPSSSDSDSDGLPDAWELANFTNLAQTAAGDPDGDGLSNSGEWLRSTNPKLSDTDADGLNDLIETGSGTYAGPAAPGTNPTDNDTDNDGHADGAEAKGTALGFESNPLIKNFAVMAVPGTFNEWKQDGSAIPSNTMTRAGTSLALQFRYVLDYHFTALDANIKYKFAGGSWDNNWGGPGDIAVSGGPDIVVMVSATGIHRFTFDQVTLAKSLTRPVFANAAAFLAAYGLATDAGGDADGDGLSNTAESAVNTDPKNNDTDGDGIPDNLDPGPLGMDDAYLLWAIEKNLPVAQQGRDVDADADGRTHLAEFLFSGNPLSGADPAAAVVATRSGGQFVLTFLARSSNAEASYRVEEASSPDEGWVTANAVLTDAADQAGVPAGYKRVTASLSPPGARHFCRVRGTEL